MDKEITRHTRRVRQATCSKPFAHVCIKTVTPSLSAWFASALAMSSVRTCGSSPREHACMRIADVIALSWFTLSDGGAMLVLLNR